GTIANADGEPFTDMINVGIGGSDLGPRALYHALAAYSLPGRKVHFISNVDPDDAAAVLKNINLSRTLVNVVSKSGTTLETLTNEELVKAAFQKAGLDPSAHFIAVTGEKSPMDNPEKYLRSFYMFDYIGGRYSATSMVGAVMLGFALGHDAFIEILKGANDMDQAAEERDIRENPALLLALLGIWNNNFLSCETVAVLPYSQALIRFTAHLQQCDMESNGKSINRQGEKLTYRTGPIVWGEPGTNGQHAFYQLIHQGTRTVPVEFIGFRKSQYRDDILIKETTSQEKLVANLLAQSLALATGKDDANPNRKFAGNRPSVVLMGDCLTPYSMGALLALYEAKIVMQGFIWNINSFDQEGVQLGKVLANRLLDHFAGLKNDTSYNGEETDELGWAMLTAAGMIK
ncbi:MAG: glucose-6-phosphate isomerase, partial [Desulfobulbaceae bacterium]|nr:glucose-6-phosphate isomerase [Desulfobulbaceae bacterium]